MSHRLCALVATLFVVNVLLGQDNGPVQPGESSGGATRKQVGELLKSLGYVKIPLDPIGADRFAVQVSIEGTALRFAVDSGAPSSWLDRKRAQHLKLGWQELSAAQQFPRQDLDPRWDWNTSCTAELVIGRVRVPQVRLFNGNLDRIAEGPVDGLLGGDVLAKHGGIIDYEARCLYLRPRAVESAAPLQPMRKGRDLHDAIRRAFRVESAAPLQPMRKESDVTVVASRRFSMPMHVHVDNLETVDQLRLYVSRDRGKTWTHQESYRTSDHCVSFTAPHDGLYWFAVQIAWKDGTREPAHEARLAPATKIYVHSASVIQSLKAGGDESQRTLDELKRAVERLKEQVAELDRSAQRR